MESAPAVETSRAATRGLRVCHVVYSFYDTDYRVRRYATALARRGDHVDVIALRREGQSRDEVIDGCHVSRLQTRSKDERGPLGYLAKVVLFLMRAAAVVASRHAKQRYDIVHVHNLPDFLVFAALIPRLTGARVILDIHDASTGSCWESRGCAAGLRTMSSWPTTSGVRGSSRAPALSADRRWC
jgi:hypothetical protein